MLSNISDDDIRQMEVPAKAYQAIRDFIYAEAGINLGPDKQMLVFTRLNKRLRHYNLSNFDDYVNLLGDKSNNMERQTAIDLLSTNETFFFREPDHFEILKTLVLESHPKLNPLRVWSAASSSGEEVYSIAMVLDDYFGPGTEWEVFGSDISSRVIAKAKKGLYPVQRIDSIPGSFLKRYCLKGVGKYEGFLLVDTELRNKTFFAEVNLAKNLPDLGLFDVIFLRNVLIYFDKQTRQRITDSLLSKLRRGGVLFVGHSESLNVMDFPLRLIGQTAYQKI